MSNGLTTGRELRKTRRIGGKRAVLRRESKKARDRGDTATANRLSSDLANENLRREAAGESNITSADEEHKRLRELARAKAAIRKENVDEVVRDDAATDGNLPRDPQTNQGDGSLGFGSAGTITAPGGGKVPPVPGGTPPSGKTPRTPASSSDDVGEEDSPGDTGEGRRRRTPRVGGDDGDSSITSSRTETGGGEKPPLMERIPRERVKRPGGPGPVDIETGMPLTGEEIQRVRDFEIDPTPPRDPYEPGPFGIPSVATVAREKTMSEARDVRDIMDTEGRAQAVEDARSGVARGGRSTAVLAARNVAEQVFTEALANKEIPDFNRDERLKDVFGAGAPLAEETKRYRDHFLQRFQDVHGTEQFVDEEGKVQTRKTDAYLDALGARVEANRLAREQEDIERTARLGVSRSAVRAAFPGFYAGRDPETGELADPGLLSSVVNRAFYGDDEQSRLGYAERVFRESTADTAAAGLTPEGGRQRQILREVADRGKTELGRTDAEEMESVVRRGGFDEWWSQFAEAQARDPKEFAELKRIAGETAPTAPMKRVVPAGSTKVEKLSPQNRDLLRRIEEGEPETAGSVKKSKDRTRELFPPGYGLGKKKVEGGDGGLVRDRVSLTPKKEKEFKEWWEKDPEIIAWKKSMGNADKSPDDPKERYDYRKAWLAGDRPMINPDDNKYHWGSTGKDKDHPTYQKQFSGPLTPSDFERDIPSGEFLRRTTTGKSWLERYYGDQLPAQISEAKQADLEVLGRMSEKDRQKLLTVSSRYQEDASGSGLRNTGMARTQDGESIYSRIEDVLPVFIGGPGLEGASYAPGGEAGPNTQKLRSEMAGKYPDLETDKPAFVRTYGGEAEQQKSERLLRPPGAKFPERARDRLMLLNSYDPNDLPTAEDTAEHEVLHHVLRPNIEGSRLLGYPADQTPPEINEIGNLTADIGGKPIRVKDLHGTKASEILTYLGKVQRETFAAKQKRLQPGEFTRLVESGKTPDYLSGEGKRAIIYARNVSEIIENSGKALPNESNKFKQSKKEKANRLKKVFLNRLEALIPAVVQQQDTNLSQSRMA